MVIKKPCSDSCENLGNSAEAFNPLHHVCEANACRRHWVMSVGHTDLPRSFLVFLRDVLKVRHTVTGMLEQKDGLQLPASLIPLQKIREVQKEKHFCKYTFLNGWTYDRQKPSILANRLLTTAGAGFHLIQRPRQAEHLTKFQRYHHRPFLFHKSFFPLQHQSSTAILTLPHKSKA